MGYCQECGAALEPSALYCGNCGHPIALPSSPPKVNETDTPTRPGYYPDPFHPDQRRLWNNGWKANTLPNPPVDRGSIARSSAAPPAKSSEEPQTGWRPSTQLPSTRQLPPKKVGASKVPNNERGSSAVKWVFGGIGVLVIVLVFVGCSQGSRHGNNSADEGSTSDNGVVLLSSCERAMSAAANVPLSQTNDDEFAVTLRSCATVAEWRDALLRFPEAAGMTSMTSADVPPVLSAACYFAPTTDVCTEAVSTGYVKR